MLLPLYLLWTAVLFQCNSIPSHFHGRSLRWNLVHVLMYDSCQWESLKCHLWVFSKHALGGSLMTYLMTCLSTMVKLLWGFQGLLCSDLNMTCFPRASQDSTSVVIESFADLPLLPWPQVIQGWLCSLTLLENEALICYLLICSLTKELLLSGWVGARGLLPKSHRGHWWWSDAGSLLHSRRDQSMHGQIKSKEKPLLNAS